MKKINFFWIILLFLLGIGIGYFGKKYWVYKEKANPKTHRVGFIFPEKENVITLDTAKSHWHKRLTGVFGGRSNYNEEIRQIYVEQLIALKQKLKNPTKR